MNKPNSKPYVFQKLMLNGWANWLEPNHLPLLLLGHTCPAEGVEGFHEKIPVTKSEGHWEVPK